MSYDEKAGSDALDARIASVAFAQVRDLTNAPPETKLVVLQTLMVALDSGMSILKDHIIDGRPEPFPDAIKVVLKQQLDCIAMARKAGVLS